MNSGKVMEANSATVVDIRTKLKPELDKVEEATPAPAVIKHYDFVNEHDRRLFAAAAERAFLILRSKRKQPGFKSKALVAYQAFELNKKLVTGQNLKCSV